MNMKELFYFTDYCSTGPQLLIGGKHHQNSKLGVLISFLISMVMVFLVIYFGIDIIQKRKPSVIISNISGEDPIFTNYTYDDLMFAWKFTDLTTATLNSTGYFTTIVKNSIGVQDGDGDNPWTYTVKYLSENTTSCDNIEQNIGRATDSILESYTCSTDFDIMLGGYYSNTKYGDLEIIISPCTEYDYCKTQEEIDEVVDNGVFFVIYYPNSDVNPKDADNPISSSYSPLLIALSTNIYTDYTRFYNNLIIQTDFGFLLEDYSQLYSTIWDYDSPIYSGRTSGNYLWFYIFTTSKQVRYERNYIKVQDVAASIGGILKILWIAGSIIMYPISKKNIDVEIMNQLYQFTEFSENRTLNKSLSINSKSMNMSMSKQNFDKLNANNSLDMNNKISNNKIDFSIQGKQINKINESSSINFSTNNNNNFSLAKLNNLKSINNNISNVSEFVLKNNYNNREEKSDINDKFMNKSLVRKDNNLINNNPSNNEINENNHKEEKNAQQNHIHSQLNILFRKDLKNIRKRNKLKFSNCELITSYMTCLNKYKNKKNKFKTIQYNKCINESSLYTDIDYLVKKLREIDMIKEILFNEEQCCSFDYLGKKIIDGFSLDNSSNVSNEGDHNKNETQHNSGEKSIKKVFEYLKLKNDNNTIDNYDQKIIDLLLRNHDD